MELTLTIFIGILAAISAAQIKRIFQLSAVLSETKQSVALRKN